LETSTSDQSSPVYPERRWVVGFSDEKVANNYATKLNNFKYGLVTLQCKLVGKLTFNENIWLSPMIHIKNLPPKCSTKMLDDWISPLSNFAFDVTEKIEYDSTSGSGDTIINTVGEAERSLILMTRNFTTFNGNVVTMEPVDGY